MRVLHLVPDIHSGGGIARYQERLISVLRDEGVEVDLIELKGASFASKIRFAAVFFLAHLRSRPDITISGHIGFLPLPYLMKKVFRREYVLNTYGIEVLYVKNRLKIKALKEAKIIIVIAEYIKEKILNRWPEIKGKIFMLPSPVEENKFIIKEKPQYLIKKYKLENSSIILTVSRLSEKEHKGYDKVLVALPEVLKKLPNAKYILVGGGDDPRVPNIIKELRIEKSVILVGNVKDEELVCYYNLADVFVLPSKFEGFGIVFLESLACGRPVIASKGFGSKAALQDGILGLMVDPDNIGEISEAIIKILQRDAEPRLYNRDFLRGEVLKKCGLTTHKNKVKALLLEVKFQGN